MAWLVRDGATERLGGYKFRKKRDEESCGIHPFRKERGMDGAPRVLECFGVNARVSYPIGGGGKAGGGLSSNRRGPFTAAPGRFALDLFDGRIQPDSAPAALRLQHHRCHETLRPPQRRGHYRLRHGEPRRGDAQAHCRQAGRSGSEAPTHRYSVSRGIPRLRKAICTWYKTRYDVDLDPETEAIVTIGSKEGIAHLCLAILDSGHGGGAQPQLPDSYLWPNYRRSARGERAGPRPGAVLAQLEDLIPRMTPRPRR